MYTDSIYTNRGTHDILGIYRDAIAVAYLSTAARKRAGGRLSCRHITCRRVGSLALVWRISIMRPLYREALGLSACLI